MRIGFLRDFAPFCQQTAAGPAGRLVDLLRRPEVRFVPAALEDLPRLLAGGQIDAILPKARTAARADQFDFSTPLARTGAALFGLAGQALVPAIAEAGPVTIATPRDGPLLALLPTLAPAAAILAVDDYAAAFEAVAAGRATFAALNADAGAVLGRGRFQAGPRFAELDLCLAARPGDGARVFGWLGLTSGPAGPA